MTKRRSSRKSSRRKFSNFLLWLFVLFLFITLTFGLVYLGKHEQYLHPKPDATKKFEVISLIKEPITLITNKIKTVSPAKAMASSKKIKGSVVQYELEIATVPDLEAADELKAELALLGFMASVTPIQINHLQKYQVSIGPYASEDPALADLNRLKQDKIYGKLKKIY